MWAKLSSFELVWAGFLSQEHIPRHYTKLAGRTLLVGPVPTPENRYTAPSSASCSCTVTCTARPFQGLAFNLLFSVTMVLLEEPSGFCTGQTVQPLTLSENGNAGWCSGCSAFTLNLSPYSVARRTSFPLIAYPWTITSCKMFSWGTDRCKLAKFHCTWCVQAPSNYKEQNDPCPWPIAAVPMSSKEL